jgi:type IV pilus assembly protein PilC
MGNFTYQARTAAGEKAAGTLEASDRKDAAAKLRKMGYTPVDIAEESQSTRGKISSALFGRIKADEMMIFYVQLHDMMSAGINLLASLESIVEQAQNKKLKDAVQDIAGRIKKGSSFSEALEQHKDIFPSLFISMMKSGESSGKLDVVLGSYATLYEEQLDLQQKVMGALFYPMILLLMGAAVILFLVTFIIPKFVTIFSDAGIALPLPTRILYVTGTAIIHYWYLMIAGGVLAFLGIRRYIRTGPGKLQLDTIKLKLPVIGPLNRNVALSRFSTTMGMLLRSGVPIIKALELTREVMQNVIMAEAITAVAGAVEKGESLSGTLKATGKFPANLIQMAAVGEGTGNLDGMLEKAGGFYDKAIASAIKKLTIVIEPLFLIVMGLAVGFIMASILLPLFKMINAVKM